MILPFKEYFDKEKTKPTYFREKILAGVGSIPTLHLAEYYNPKLHIFYNPKLHTIRAGQRWKEGMKMHMAYGVRTKNYRQFNDGIPELEFCKGVQSIKIEWEYGDSPYVFIDDRGIENHDELLKIAINDGFDSVEDFFAWFNEDFEGQIIHFTNLKY